MVYNFNLGIGWASSGVEYAQAYRANVFRRIGQEAKFVFTDMFPQENIEHMTANLGFLDSEILWLYTFFTDCRIAPVSFTLKQLDEQFSGKKYRFSRRGKRAKYVFEGENNFCMAYLTNETSDLVHRVEIVSGGKLIRKDYYTYCRIYTEYYAPARGKAHLYLRRFFNEDGTTAYEEIIDEGAVMYRFEDRLLCSKEELVGYMVERLQLTKEDVVIIDRTTGIGQAILQQAKEARIGIVIHAEHFSEGNSDGNNILWNNYYEYAFSQNSHVSFYVTATEAQRKLLLKQFQKYQGVTPRIEAIPVGSLDELKRPQKGRKPFSCITASRLAPEKHIDWLISAVVLARKQIPELTLDIYGEGGQQDALQKQIEKLHCSGYVRLCGQQNLENVYMKYEAYLSASTSEGFGLSLLEAIGSGLPMIGFDVRYGNQAFIEEGKNGYRIPFDREMDDRVKIQKLAEKIICLFSEADREKFQERSYQVAKKFLTKEVEKKWKKLL